MAKKTQRATIAISTLANYGLFGILHKKVDAYTRAAVALSAGLGMCASQTLAVRHIGIGMGIAGLLQIADVVKGGRLTKNEATTSVFVLHENKEIIELNPGEIPAYNIDGFAYKGLNGVFKLSDGVYAGINTHNQIKVYGVAALVNKVTGAGLKTKEWVLAQPDKRWIKLYALSV